MFLKKLNYVNNVKESSAVSGDSCCTSM